MVQELLTEKLRPKKIEHMILPQRIRNVFSQGLQQNVLLAGSPGCVKFGENYSNDDSSILSRDRVITCGKSDSVLYVGGLS